jgi:tRNA A-37 threonylcarbamoyl transferase component Bud32
MGAATPELIAPGTLLGKYRIIHRIAYGGMAEIYLARASGIQGFEKYVVLKRILPQYAANHELIRMFLQEARLAAMLDHANIAQVHDIGEQAGTFFFTMEYLHGEDARWIYKRLVERGDPMPLEHAVHIVIDAAAGLNFAHEKKSADGRSLGIVHRDLSPSNIVVTYAGEVKVVDFGVAKIASESELSGRYSLKGKLAYMSPEQITQGTVDRRSDVFSLGIVLYELTTGKRLFKGASEVEAMKLVLETSVVHPSGVKPDYPLELERIVLRALARSPEQRYQTARELQLDLEAFARDQKLQISSAALAEWMEASFGPKREIWHTLPALPPPAADLAATPVHENTGATRKVTHAELADLPAFADARPRARARRTVLVTSSVMLLVLLVGGGALALRRRAAGEAQAPPGAASPGATVLVVAENGSVAIEHGAAARAAAPLPAVPAAAAVAAPAPAPEHARETPPTVGSRSLRAGRAHRAANPDDLSSAVARRSAEIRRCFVDLDADASTRSDIALRFEVGTDGAVKSLAVLPATVAATPLDACLVKVGRGTTFAVRPAPITFRIPVSVQLRQQEGGR